MLGSRPGRAHGQRLLSLLLAMVTAAAVVLPLPGTALSVTLRKVPGPSPQQTLDNFLELTARADTAIFDAIHQGMAEPGWLFAPTIRSQATAAITDLQQATEALDLSKVPVALRPMTGVSTMLMLRSLLRYDLSRHPGLDVPDLAQVKRAHLKVWTLPESPITLRAISDRDASSGQACRQCSAGDFLFSSDTLTQAPDDFQRVFANNRALRRQFGADLYTYWALLPGGAIPPKLYLQQPPAVQHVLLTPMAGQSLLQWLLLVPSTLAGLGVLGWWLWTLRRWRRNANDGDDAWPHLIKALAVVPPLLLVSAWQGFAVDWINLNGARQEAVLIGGRVATGLLQALLTYLLAEAMGQLIIVKRQRDSSGAVILKRRKGAGQILTLARILGLTGVLLIVIQTGRDLGMTSLTLLALSSVPALAISLGTQQLIHDIADGFSLLLDGQVKTGDHCTIGTGKSGELRGVIVSLGMRSVRLKQDDGSILAIPNSQVASSVMTNHRFQASEPFRLSLPISDTEPNAVQSHLQRVRDLLDTCPSLDNAKAELAAADQGWQLRIKGSWLPDLTKLELMEAREQLMLRLLQLDQQHQRSDAIPSASPDRH